MCLEKKDTSQHVKHRLVHLNTLAAAVVIFQTPPHCSVVPQCGELLYEKRQYEKGHWACIRMREDTYEQSICYGFMRIMKYICQQNSLGKSDARDAELRLSLACKRLRFNSSGYNDSLGDYLGMTLPIVTVVRTNETHSVMSNDVTVAYFLPAEHQAQPPQPADSEIFTEIWPATTVYTRWGF